MFANRVAKEAWGRKRSSRSRTDASRKDPAEGARYVFRGPSKGVILHEIARPPVSREGRAVLAVIHRFMRRRGAFSDRRSLAAACVHARLQPGLTAVVTFGRLADTLNGLNNPCPSSCRQAGQLFSLRVHVEPLFRQVIHRRSALCCPPQHTLEASPTRAHGRRASHAMECGGPWFFLTVAATGAGNSGPASPSPERDARLARNPQACARSGVRARARERLL